MKIRNSTISGCAHGAVIKGNISDICTMGQFGSGQKWLTPVHYRAPKPLAMSEDDILTNDGAYKVGKTPILEKISLPADLNLNAVKSSKIMTIKRVIITFRLKARTES